MSEKFLKCIEVVLRNEGGYVNDPKDPGGETNFGISKKSYPALDIKALTRDQAIEIYFNDYWLKLPFEDVTPDLLALHMFDMSVNTGSKIAVKILQSILRIDKDGILGTDTLQQIERYENPQRLVNLYIDARKDFYKSLAASRTGLNVFLRGWTNRVKNTNFAIC